MAITPALILPVITPPCLPSFLDFSMKLVFTNSSHSEMGLYTIFVYFVVQSLDGYILVPMIAKKTVDLAPALVLMSQLIFGVLFGILGLALADPLLAMIKVWLERRAHRLKSDHDTFAPGAEPT